MDKRQSHTVLKNIHIGADIWVLGSGTSLQFIKPNFFNGKITIGPSKVWEYFRLNYNVHKHTQFIEEASKHRQVIIASKHDCGDIDQPLNEQEYIDYIFTHKRGRFGELEKNFTENIKSLGKDEDIFVSYSTISSCIHLAAYMGATNIILVGHDCGWIDKKSHMFDYGERLKKFHKDKFNGYHAEWFKQILRDSQMLRDTLREIYKCNIYSLNPFLNLGLEGHVYSTQQ